MQGSEVSKSQGLKGLSVGEIRKRRLKKHGPVLRARANQASGRRFELAVIKAFQIAGFRASRVDEADGFVRGWDIRLEEFPGLVIQCKAGGPRHVLYRGLEEARKHNPDARAWACIHSWRRTGRAPQIRVAFTENREGRPGPIGLAEFLTRLNKSRPDVW